MKENQEIVNWLGEFTSRCREIAALEERIKAAQESYEALSARSREAMKADFEKDIADIERARDKSLAVCREIAEAIDSITDAELKEILWNRYMKGLKWRQVALEMNLSQRAVYKKHREAIALLAKGWYIHAVALREPAHAAQ